MIVQLRLLWLMLLPWCLGVNDSDDNNKASGSNDIITDDLLDRDIITLNGKKTTLRKIYDDVLPTTSNFNVGPILAESFRAGRDVVISSSLPDVDAICAGGQYIQRTFSHYTFIGESQSWRPLTKDVSTEIAKKLVGFTSGSNAEHVPPVIILAGDPRSGKSVALAKIQSTLVEMKTSVWSIRVDLKRMYPETALLDDMTFENIVEKVIKPDVTDLFNNLLKVNPKKIVMLFDGMEHLTDIQTRTAATLIESLLEKRVSVVLTSHRNINDFLQDRVGLNGYYCIEKMSIQEAERFLMNIWRLEIMKEALPGPSISICEKCPDNGDIETRLKEYAQAFSHVYFQTRLERQPIPLMVMADVFTRQSSSPLILLPQNTNYPVTCLDYVLHPSSSSPALFIAIEHALLNKNALYEKIIERMQSNVRDFTSEYSIVALKGYILKSTIINDFPQFPGPFDGLSDAASSRRKTFILPNDFDMSVQTAVQTLKDHKESAILITSHWNDIQFDISFYSEFQEYYMAKFLISAINDQTAPYGFLEQFLTDSHFREILPFLNGQIEKLPLFELLVLPSHSVMEIIKATLTSRCENLFRYMFDGILDTLRTDTILAKEFNTILFITEMTFESLAMGMQIVDKTHWHPNPFYSYSPTTRSPMYMLMQYGELRTLERLQSTGFLLGSDNVENLDYARGLLKLAVTRTAPNLDVVKFLMDHHIASDLSPDHMNELLHCAIHYVGDGCQPIAKYLVERGAQARVELSHRYLLQSAVRWNSVKLLRFLETELKVPILDMFIPIPGYVDETIFTAILDANPSPLYTFPGWYEMMAYFVDKTGPFWLKTNIDFHSLSTVETALSMWSVRTPAVQLLTLNNGPIEIFSDIDSSSSVNSLDFNNDDDDNYRIELNPLERVAGYSEADISDVTRFIPFTSWYGVNPNVLSYRRISMLHERRNSVYVSPFEMLLRYRGARTLEPVERQYYDRALRTLLAQEQQFFQDVDMIEIGRQLWHTVGDSNDFSACQYLLDEIFRIVINVNNVDSFISRHALHWLRQIIHSVIIPEEFTAHTPSMRLRESRLTFTQGRLVNNELPKRIISYLRIIRGSVLSSWRRLEIVTDCFRRRGQRNIQHFPQDCLISWHDVDQFNDATMARHVLSEIRVNSDRFLYMLAAIEYTNSRKANQLVTFVRELEDRLSTPAIITGESQMVVRDLLRHTSFAAYRQNKRFSSLRNELWHPLPNEKPRTFLFPSRTAALYAASVIPIIRGIYATVQMCLQQHNDTNDNKCLYSSGILVLSVTLGPVGTAVIKYTPWMIDVFSQVALDTLPSAAPRILRENVKLMRHFGLKYGGKTAVVGLAIVGIGFDLYNIVEMSKMIDMCSKQGNECLSKDKIDYIISLTFSCVSIAVTGGLMMSGIGFVPGLLIGLGLMVLEGLAMGINDLIYYSNKYDTNGNENIRIFWHKVAFQPPPADVQELARRTDLINHLQKSIIQFLEESNENIVAYGVGLGSMTNNGDKAGFGFIDMRNPTLENTRGLSRVLPTANNNLTRLCLPHEDTSKVYEKHPNEFADAKYRCDNTFVIAHKQRWNTKSSDKSFIIYDLGLVKRGRIVGSNTLNNLFLIYNSTRSLEVIGGDGNISNTYIIQTEYFRGFLFLYQQSRKHILHLSDLKSSILHFWWAAKHNVGKVQFGNNKKDFFSLGVTSTDVLPNLHIIGRTGESERFTCNHYNGQRLSDDKSLISISIDGDGGQSHSNMDYVVDCKISMVRPFTNIIGSKHPNASYTTYVKLDYLIVRKNIIEHATIQPQQSKFNIIFDNSPLLGSSYSVKYMSNSKTLIWHLQYRISSSLLLSITPYRSAYSTLQQNTTDIEAVNCIFVDNYFQTIIYPVIYLPADKNSTVTIRNFNVFATVNSSRLNDVISRYINITTFKHETFFIVAKLTYPKTGQTFMFGSNGNDQFYIDGNTTFLFGGDGSDVYALTRESPNYVWIDNRADDRALDTLVIPDSSCDLLWAAKGSNESSCCDSSPYDVTLFCSFRTNATYHKNVILRNYLLKSHSRHLQIYWHDTTYILLPDHWTQKDHDYNDIDVKLAVFISFGHQGQIATLTLKNHNTYVVFNGTDDVTNSLVAYRSQNNIIMAKKYFNRNDSSFVELQDFFSNDTNGIAVSTKWQQLKIFSIDNVNDNAVPKIITVADILDLLFIAELTEATNASDLTKEYFVDMNDTSRNNTIIIEHAPRSMMNNGTDQLGVLIVAGANPGEFHSDLDRQNGTSLALCARETCIIIKNWCRSIRHRLYRMEFVSPLNRRPIVIPHMDQLDCQEQVINSSNDDEFLEHLNEKFAVAQSQLTDEFDDNDEARLMRCIGSIIIANIIANSSLHRLFGFSSGIDHASFMYNNCPVLFSRENLVKKLAFTTMNTTLQNAIKKYQLNSDELTLEEQNAILLLSKIFGQLNNQCWDDFKSSLYQRDNRTESNVNIVTLQTLNHISFLLSRCVKGIQ